MFTVVLILGGAIAVLGLVALSACLRGWVLSILWGWFMVPYFGLPELTIPLAIGLALVISLLTHAPNMIKSEYQQDTMSQLVGTLCAPLFVLFFGWIVTLFL